MRNIFLTKLFGFFVSKNVDDNWQEIHLNEDRTADKKRSHLRSIKFKSIKIYFLNKAKQIEAF